MLAQLKSKLYKFAGLLSFVGVAVYSVLVVFVRVDDEITGHVFDGLNRQVELAPLWARLFLIDDAMWAGFWWHCADGLIAGCLFGLGYLLLIRRRD